MIAEFESTYKHDSVYSVDIKFQAIGKKTNKHNLTFNLNGNNITCEDNVKLLGVTIDSNLNFNNHISEICSLDLLSLNLLKTSLLILNYQPLMY
jgi:hypothetical protein